MAAGLIHLTFGNTRVEVSAEALPADFEALGAEVEAKFGLHPGSFSIFDDVGKVDDVVALQRAMDMAVDGSCVLEVREAPEWQKIREMETKINMLVSRCPMVDNALMSIEERSAKRFVKLASAVQAVDEQAVLRAELTRAELRQEFEDLDKKVSRSIAPLLQCVTLEQMELKAKLDSLDASLLSQEMSIKVNCGIAPMLQSMAIQQMDLKAQLDSLQFAHDTKEVSHLMAYAVKVEEVEEVTKDLQKEMGVRSVQLKALQDEVRNLGEQPITGDGWGRILSAAQQDLGKPPKNLKNGLGGGGCDGDSYAQWLEGSSIDMSSPMLYSKKSAYNSSNIGGAAAVPFARFVAPRQLNHMQASRSLPHLPPVK